MVARCNSWLLILWCLMSAGLDLFASAVPAATSGIRDSIPSPVEVGGSGYWKERCKRGDWDQNDAAVPRHLRVLCRNAAEASPRVDPLEEAFLEALIRPAADVGNSDEEGTKRLREEDGRPLKLLEKIRRFVEEEDEEEEEETGGRELQSKLSNGGGGERSVYEDGEPRSSISVENSAPVVKRGPSGDWTHRQKSRASLFALARFLNSKRGYARATRNKDARGNLSTHGPRMSLYFLG